MPLHVCVTHYRCPNCGTVLRGNGDIGCVFTAYGSVPCPFVQDACAMVAWFEHLDMRQRQRAHLHAIDPEQWMRHGEMPRGSDHIEDEAPGDGDHGQEGEARRGGGHGGSTHEPRRHD